MIERITEHTQGLIILQNEQRKSWSEHDTPQTLEDMIRHEGVIELQKAIEECMIGAPPEYLISELGDTLYLYVKRKLGFPNDPIPEDVEQIVENAVKLCDELNVDPNHAAAMKMLRNDMKYTHSVSNNGFSYEESVALSKAMWTEFGGDEKFYEVWEKFGDRFVEE